jgi:hypothetical protein
MHQRMRPPTPMRTRPQIPSQCPHPIFEAANQPLFEKLYKSVRDGTEMCNAFEFDGRNTYARMLRAQDWHEHRDAYCHRRYVTTPSREM